MHESTMTSRGIAIPCLMVPANKKMIIKKPEIKLTGRDALKNPRKKYPRVDNKFPIKMVSNT